MRLHNSKARSRRQYSARLSVCLSDLEVVAQRLAPPLLNRGTSGCHYIPTIFNVRHPFFIFSGPLEAQLEPSIVRDVRAGKIGACAQQESHASETPPIMVAIDFRVILKYGVA